MNKTNQLRLLKGFNLSRVQKEKLIKLLNESNSEGGGGEDKDAAFELVREVYTGLYGEKYDDKLIVLNTDEYWERGTNIDLKAFINSHNEYIVSEEVINNPLYKFKELKYADGNNVKLDEFIELGKLFGEDVYAYAPCDFILKQSDDYNYKLTKYEDNFIHNIRGTSSNGDKKEFVFVSYNNIIYYAFRVWYNGSSGNKNVFVFHGNPKYIVNHNSSTYPNKVTFHYGYNPPITILYNNLYLYTTLDIDKTNTHDKTIKMIDDVSGDAYNVVFTFTSVTNDKNFTNFEAVLNSVTKV